MLTSIAGRSVIVTGASRGIGKGIARLFAQKGAHVLLMARSKNELEAAAGEIRDSGGSASTFVGDVTNPADMTRMARVAIDQHGDIDVLCCNAGIFPSAKIREMTPENWDEVLDTNLKGTFLAVHACLPSLCATGRGRIIVTSSITGPITGYSGWSHYGASKAGQLGFIRTAALELARDRVTINALLPGNIVTEGIEALGKEYEAEMTQVIPEGRMGSVTDVAYAALFLASDEAAFITGQTLVIDGGQVLPESPAAFDRA
jgi:3-oxoacyl-[acyl-carrier protein] reductase